MDEDTFKLSSIILTENPNFINNDITNIHKIDKIRIGNYYVAVVVCKYPGKLYGEEIGEWKRKIIDATVYSNIQQYHEHGQTKLSNNIQITDTFSICDVCSSVIENFNDSLKPVKKLKQWFLDNQTFVIALPVCLRNFCHCSNKVKLSISLTSVDRRPLDHNVLNTEEDFQLHFREITSSRKDITHQKIFTEEVRVLSTPNLLFRFVNTNGKYLIFIKVSNQENGTFEIYGCTILYGICHLNTHNEDTQGSKTRSTCQVYGDELNISNRESCKFPALLSPGEEIVLVFSLHILDSNHHLKNMDLHAHLKWKSAGQTGSKVTSSYRLPSLKLQSIPFVLSAQCLNTDPIRIGHSFTVIYSVVNKLQNFLSWRLYWSPEWPENAVNENRRQECEFLKKYVVCNDPYIDFGQFPEGTSSTTAVNFQVLRHGLYEFGKHMKLNLSYAVNPHIDDDLSLKSPRSETASVCSSDRYIAASEELWHDRIGSTSSLGSSRDIHSAAGRRESFATKSYSFGDLGPELSLDSNDADKNKFKDRLQHSPLQTPTEEIYRIPTTNFKKNSYQLYV